MEIIDITKVYKNRINKEKQEETQRLVKRYPFISTGSEDYCLYDEIPEGWRSLFLQLCDDIASGSYNKALSLYNASFGYGSMILDADHDDDRIIELLAIYSRLSKNICIYCGRPDVPCFSTPFFDNPFNEEESEKIPCCKSCYEKRINRRTDPKWEDLLFPSILLSSSATYTLYRNKRMISVRVDITEEADRYREKFNGSHTDTEIKAQG